jgi:FAD/FMN-containing dehydrogenase
MIRGLNGESVGVPQEAIEALRSAVRGAVFLPGEDGYDVARTLWNGMVDRRPALIVRCAGAADVMKAVDLARDHGLLLAVRGGGHNIAGNAVCDGGMMIDLSPMKSVRVDPAAQRAWVEPGVTLGELDNETQAHALAVPTGINSTTGIAGLTLGGGFGWTTRTCGMTVDNLISADVVTADGRLVRASSRENPDLFWAIRGGGGNFGVVTAFEFQLHAVGPEVLSGLIVHPFENARDLLTRYRKIAATAPDELTCWAVLRKAPPLPFLPEDVHGTEILAFALCYTGDIAAGEEAVAELRGLGEPIADVVGPHPFMGWQAAFDPLLTPGARNYWKSHDFLELSDPAIEALLDYAGRLPTPECEIFVAHVGGAMSRVPTDATAFTQRNAHFVMNVHTRWQDAAQDETCIQWARDFFNDTAPYSAGSVYVNFMPDDEADRIGGAYGSNYDRLTRVKAQYDPNNLFRMNQNIPPATGARAAE